MAEKVTYIPTVIQEEDNIYIDPASVSRTIYVTGFQAGTKPEELIIHFQRRKNGGGDIVGIVISSWQRAAAITFDSPEVAKSVLQLEQEFGGVILKVKPYEENVTKDYSKFECVLSNGVHCSLHQSDITDERVDAIVHAANKWLRHGDGVAAAIMRKGGHQIEEEFRRIMSDRKGRPLNVGDVVYTSGGNLSCRFVIHTVGPKWNNRQNKKSISLLHRVCMESLRLATQLELCSMAFPAIGSGNFGLPKDICAQVMFDAVKEFSSSTDAELGTLRDVRIVIIDDETISVFREEFVKRYTSQETSPATNVKHRGLSRKQKAATSHCVNLAPREPISSKTKSVIDGKTDLLASSIISNVSTSKQAGLEIEIHKYKDQAEVATYTQEAKKKYSVADEENVRVPTEPVLPGEIASEKQDSKQIKKTSDLRNNWRQVQSDVAQMRQTLDEEKLARNIRKQELKQKETVLINTLQNALCEEQQERTRVEEELSQARIACNELERRLRNELAQVHQTLDNETRLRNTREQELSKRETDIDEMQETLGKEQQARTRVEEELRQARTDYNELERRLQNEIAQMHQALDKEIRLCDSKNKELRAKETILNAVQTMLGAEKRAKTRITEELSQARSICSELEERLQNEMLSTESLQQELSAKENSIREQQRDLEEERSQKSALEERLRNLQLEMDEQRNSHETTERELESALSAAQDALVEYQRRQPRDWIIQREEVVVSENVLGKGAWGNVCEGTFRSCKVAVKEIHELILSDHNRRMFEREMRIASCCRHPNLLQLIGATNDDDNPLFVTELLDTSLRHVLSQRALNQNEIVSLALDVAKGLNYLHLSKPLPIIHRDISSANVLLWRRDECWRAKLSDYGSANFMLQVMTINPGAIIYSAPEVFTSQQSPKVDVYSFGLLLCEMCIRELPDPQEVRNQIRQVTNRTLRGLIQRCVNRDPEERPTMSDVISTLEELSRSKRV